MKVRVAGVGSTFPEGSIARTENLSAPAPKAGAACGEEQGSNAPASRLHSKVESGSPEVNANVGVPPPVASFHRPGCDRRLGSHGVLAVEQRHPRVIRNIDVPAVRADGRIARGAEFAAIRAPLDWIVGDATGRAWLLSQFAADGITVEDRDSRRAAWAT